MLTKPTEYQTYIEVSGDILNISELGEGLDPITVQNLLSSIGYDVEVYVMGNVYLMAQKGRKLSEGGSME